MSIFSDIFSREPVVFAETLAEKIQRQFPPSVEPQLVKKGAQRRLEGVLEPIMKDIEAFRSGSKPGWIGKARFGNAFRWKLKDSGYSEQFVEALTEGVIKNITFR